MIQIRDWSSDVCSSDLSAITLTKDGKTGDCKRIFGIMGLAVKAGNEITLTFDGEDEEAAYAAVTEFVKANL